MSSKDKWPQTVTGNFLEHPAVGAWAQVSPWGWLPDGVEVLREGRKSRVYRLPGAGPGRTSIVAKRGMLGYLQGERDVYEKVLSNLPLLSPRCHGFLADRAAQCDWLFLEDAGQEEYLPTLAEHRALSTDWRAQVHTQGAHLEAAASLPDAGPERYLEYLRVARTNIMENLGNPRLGVDDRRVLGHIISQCDCLERHWGQLERFCANMPRTLVHSDLVPKNLRVRTTSSGVVFLAFDWECAGWGIPAADQFRDLDVAAYWAVVRKSWPWLELTDIQRMAQLGAVFRCLAAFSWASSSLSSAWVEDAMAEMRFFSCRLPDGLGLSDH